MLSIYVCMLHVCLMPTSVAAPLLNKVATVPLGAAGLSQVESTALPTQSTLC